MNTIEKVYATVAGTHEAKNAINKLKRCGQEVDYKSLDFMQKKYNIVFRPLIGKWVLLWADYDAFISEKTEVSIDGIIFLLYNKPKGCRVKANLSYIESFAVNNRVTIRQAMDFLKLNVGNEIPDNFFKEPKRKSLLNKLLSC